MPQMQPVAIGRRTRTLPGPRERTPILLDLLSATATRLPASACSSTGLALGIRHGIDWDHIAAITDITSTTAAAGAAEAAHEEQHRSVSGHHHGHGGTLEIRAHDAGPGAATLAPAARGRRRAPFDRVGREQVEAIRLARCMRLATAPSSSRSASPPWRSARCCPDWLDPIMGRIVGLTLVALGAVGPLLGLPVRARRRVVPTTQPLDARLRRRSATRGDVPGRGSTATSTSSRSR